MADKEKDVFQGSKCAESGKIVIPSIHFLNNYLPIPAFDLYFTTDLEPELPEPLAGEGQEGDGNVPTAPAFISV